MGNWFSSPKGTVYKVTSPHTNRVYIGSTNTTDLKSRLFDHEGNYRVWKATNAGWYSVFLILEYGDYKIERLETVRGNLKVRERYYFDQYATTRVNKRAPYRSPLEKKQKWRQYCKMYYKKNRERILQRQAYYRKRISKV